MATAQAITDRWDIPVVFLTAHSDQATVNRAQAAQLQEALVRIRKLSACLPICARCRRIREDDPYWQDLQALNNGGPRTESESTANLCPDCLAQLQGAVWAAQG